MFFKCELNADFRRYDLWQCGQSNGLSPVWINLKWSFHLFIYICIFTRDVHARSGFGWVRVWHLARLRPGLGWEVVDLGFQTCGPMFIAQASSAPSESLFSFTGLMLNSKRNQLASDKVSAVSFLPGICVSKNRREKLVKWNIYLL